MNDSIRQRGGGRSFGEPLRQRGDFVAEPDSGAPASASSFRLYLAAAVKDRRRIFRNMALVLGIAFAAALASRPTFVAESTLLVLLSPDYSPRAAGDDSKSGASIVVDRDAVLKDEVEILTSPALEKETLKTVGLERVYPDALKPPGLRARMTEWFGTVVRSLFSMAGVQKYPPRAIDPLDLAAAGFAKDLTATADKSGDIIVVTFRHRDPEIAADVVNAQIKAYFDKRTELLRDVQSNLVAEQAKVLRKELDRVSRDYSDYKESNQISDYSNQRLLLLRQQGETSRDLQQAERSIAQSSQRLSVLQKELEQSPQDAGPYRNQIRTRPVVSDTLQVDRNRAQQELQASTARRATDVTQLAQLDAQLKNLDQKEFELERLDGQRKLVSDNYSKVMKALDERMFQEDVMAKKTSNIRVIQPAEVPVAPNNLRLMIVGAGIALSLFAGVATAFLSEALRRGYLTPETLEHHVRAPVLASVPSLRSPPRLIAASESAGPAKS
ncbi:GumC family protein [Methylocapsa palsarum]|uniref:Uncharacterized protein involved in exopolysaccharide biosynthesis n=1 Tax=Methylocapsa palsarum TaxID=1612308 RepID=A0A1I4C2S1_9HYPH|nr:hypothetical protein [Methylocapsa palsarum]SFK74717.1 Uncharacterized protein involved in exopolysaccharide biosynthesis [Methylocapsa palsarum]